MEFPDDVPEVTSDPVPPAEAELDPFNPATYDTPAATTKERLAHEVEKWSSTALTAKLTERLEEYLGSGAAAKINALIP
jgi:hypothetical protein